MTIKLTREQAFRIVNALTSSGANAIITWTDKEKAHKYNRENAGISSIVYNAIIKEDQKKGRL